MTEDRPAQPGTPDDTARTAIDTTVPHSARIWNYWLGGKDNYAVDRAAGDAYVKVYPGIVDVARAGRAFLARAVRYLAIEAGIRQFLDVGTGLPTADNTHQIAQAAAPQSRIVYVDSDPLVLAHARALLTSSPEGATEYIDADMRDPEAVLARAGASLDFDQPVALLLMGVMGHIEDDDQAQSIVRSLRAGLSPGSYLAAYDGVAEVIEAFAEAQQGYDDTGAIPYKLRGPEQVAGFFEGLEFVEPGLVRAPQWRPEAAGVGAGPDSPSLAAVARKP
jgi:S-adenosyl methyltransferase